MVEHQNRGDKVRRKKKVTLKTLAEELGVSTSVVSRVLSGQASKYRISKDTEAAVLKAARRYDYSPNHLARSLRLQKTATLGLVIPDISNPFFSDIARQIVMDAWKRDYSVILCDSEENTEMEKQSLNLLQNRQVEGLIISPVGQTGDHLARVYRGGLPLVVFDRHFSDIDLPCVTSDNQQGAYEATLHLLEHGHRSIALIQGIPDSATNIARVSGYKAALKDYGVPFSKTLIVGGGFGEENGYAATKLLLKRKDRPTAIFLVSNLIALGALRAFAEEGTNVPGDISIVSFDDQHYSPYLATPMTTIAQQRAEMGRIAVELLLDQLERKGRRRPEVILLPTELISRQSVRDLRKEACSKASE